MNSAESNENQIRNGVGTVAANANCSDPESSKKADNLCLLLLVLIMFFDLIAFTSILPLMPAILVHYGRGSDSNNLYSSLVDLLNHFQSFIGAPADSVRFHAVFFGGLLGSLFSFLQFLSAPLAGACSDIYGRKKVLLVSLFGSLLSYFIWSQASTFELFVLSRIIGGLSKCSVSLATTIVADFPSPSFRSKGMALVGVAFAVGFIVVDAALAININYMPAALAMFSTAVAICLVIGLLPETLPKEKRSSNNKLSTLVGKRLFDYANPIALLRFSALGDDAISPAKSSQLQRLGLIYFLYLFLFSGLEFTLSFLCYLRFDYDSMAQGRMYFFAGVVMILVQGGYVSRTPASLQDKAALKGLVCIIPAFIIIGFAYNQIVFFVGLSLYSVASAIVVPCLTTIAASFSNEQNKGTLMGIFRSLGSLARALGPFIFAAIFWLGGSTLCYVIGGCCLFLPVILFKRLSLTIKSD